MHYSLTPFTGDGTPSAGPAGNPFLPLGFDQPGWGMLDLRGLGIPRALLAVPTRDDRVGQDYLGGDGDLDTSRPLLRTLLQNRMGGTFQAATLRGIVAELLIGRAGIPANPLTNRWEIWLGGQLLYTMPVLAGGAPLTESFNKADNGLGPDQTWTAIVGTWAVRSLKAQVTAVATNSASRIGTALASGDHFCEATSRSTSTANFHNDGVIFRQPGGTTQTYYTAICIYDAQTIRMSRFNAGAETVLDSDKAVTLNANTNYVVKGQANGATLTSFLDAVQKHNFTDGSPLPGTNVLAGVTGYSLDGTVSAVTLVSWSADDLYQPFMLPALEQQMASGGMVGRRYV